MNVIVGIAAYLAFHGKYAEALGIGGLLTGLIGLATMLARPNSPQGNTQADTNLATALDKMNPQTPGMTTPSQESRA